MSHLCVRTRHLWSARLNKKNDTGSRFAPLNFLACRSRQTCLYSATVTETSSTPLRALALLLASTLLLAACGGSHSKATGGSGSGQRVAGASAPAFLAKPLYARCGTSTFVPPTTSGTARDGWQVVYAFPAISPRPPRPGQTTRITIVESSASGRRGQIRGGREIVVAGRSVSFLDRTARAGYVAQWKTKTAHYIALADGRSAQPFERVIACLP
jgi:hypothetical protein